MKLLFISSLLVAATNAADVDRRRINGITFADQAVEALNLVHKGQASSSTVLIKKGESDNKGGDDKSSRDDKSSNDKSSNSKSSSSGSSGSRSSSRDGRGVCGEKKDYCKNYDSSSFLNIKKEDGNKSSRDDKSSNDKSSGSSKSKSSNSSTSSRDGDRRTDRCFRACDTDRCTSDDRRRLACDSTAASSDMKFVQKGQASPIQKQKLVWAAKGDDSEGSDDAKTSKDNDSPDDKSDDKDNSKSDNSKSSSGDNDRKWSGSGDDICKDAPKDWCEGSSADSDDDCDDACDKDGCDKEERKYLGCDATSKDVAATKKLRRRKA